MRRFGGRSVKVMPAAEHAALRAREQALLGGGVGVCATALAVGGHLIGGGATPRPPLLAVLTVAAIAAGVLVSRTRWRLPALLSVVVVMQGVFHLALGGPAGSSAHAGHAAAHSHATHSATTGFGWHMLAAHLAAVLVTALALRRGAQICRLIAAVLATPFGIIRGLLGPAPLPTYFAPHGPEIRRAPMLAQLVLCAAPRRGPPAPLAT